MITCNELFERYNSSDAAEQQPSDNPNRYLFTCERAHIMRVLEGNDWHISHTAGSLGVSRKNLWEKMKKLQIRKKS